MENCGNALKAFLRLSYRSSNANHETDPMVDIEEKYGLAPIVDKFIPVSDFHDVLGRIYPTEAKDPITAPLSKTAAESKEKTARLLKQEQQQYQQQQHIKNTGGAVKSKEKPQKTFVVRMKKHEGERKSRIERDVISNSQVRGLYWKHRKPADVSVFVKKLNAPTLLDQFMPGNQTMFEKKSRSGKDGGGRADMSLNIQKPIVRYKTIDENGLTETHVIAA
jgi:hypothetical protein